MSADPRPTIEDAHADAARRALAAVGVAVGEGDDDAPVFNAQSIAAALVDRRGRVLAASAAFSAMDGARHVDPELAAKAAAGEGPYTVAVELTTPDGVTDAAIWSYARASRAAGWRLPPEVRAAADAEPAMVVILTSQFAGQAPPLEAAARAYGLTGLQTRVALETVRTGNARAAAARLGVSYHTAREALEEAMRRTRAKRLPALVSRLTSLAFGVLPEADAGDVLGDLWGLTPRQAALAALVADGLSRGEAARALGLSEAVVKKELDRVYLVLQVGTAPKLARKLVEARALRWLTQATGHDVGFLDPDVEPMRIVHRPDGRRIAVSDYGPASGRPVLVVHSSMTSRIVGRRTLRALQAAGYRPISIDRPGFGLTDELEGARAGAHDPFAAAVPDALQVLDALKIARTDLVARGAAQFVLALGQAAPERLGRVVLVNPDPDSRASGTPDTAFGRMKEAFSSNPEMIRFVVRYLARQFSVESAGATLQRHYRGSPPDEAAARDPEIQRDYFRAQRMFATGRIAGCVNEQVAFARGSQPPPWRGASDWRVLIGAHDTLHDPQRVLAYWRAVLPDAQFQVFPDAGRLMAFSHPQHLVEALGAEA